MAAAEGQTDKVTAQSTGGSSRVLKDLFAGAAGGVAQVLLGNCIRARINGF